MSADHDGEYAEGGRRKLSDSRFIRKGDYQLIGYEKEWPKRRLLAGRRCIRPRNLKRGV